MKFSIAFLFAAIAVAGAIDADTKASLDSVKSHHELRMAKLEQMIEERRRLKEDHDAGRRRLTSEEYDRANKQLKTFSRKLEQMKKRTDEDHLERIEELKGFGGMRHADFYELKQKVEEKLGSK